MAHKKGHHTGKIHHTGGSLSSHGGKEKLANDTYHKHNKECGMSEGFCPPEGYQGGEYEAGGAPSMESNTSSSD